METTRRVSGLWFVVVAGAVVALASRRRARPIEALQGYLDDHLSGADAGLTLVRQLARTRAGAVAALGQQLEAEFLADRAVLERLRHDVAGRVPSLKRTLAQGVRVGVGVLAAPASDSATLRQLEALAIGIQGKRLLWRALGDVADRFTAVTLPELAALERTAERQWTQVDTMRRSVGRRLFSGPATR